MMTIGEMSRVERIRYSVIKVLVRKYGIAEEKAKMMVMDSSFNDTLLDDPDFIGHRSADYWAADVMDEYSVVQ